MKKFLMLGKVLSKNDQKKIKGGLDEPEPGGCIACWGGPGIFSCWYTNSGCSVCDRVYPNSPDPCLGATECTGCTLN